MERYGAAILACSASLVMLTLTLLCGGCAVSARTGYTWLEPVAPPDGSYVMTQGKKLLVAVGPVDVPGYITRAAAIMDTTINPANVSSVDREAGMLEWEIPRVVAENMRRLLVPYGIEVVRDSRGRNADYRVAVDLTTFEVTGPDILETRAKWTLYGPDGRSVMMEKDVVFSTPLGDRGQTGARGAMSHALADLTGEIVKDLGGVLGTR